MATAIKASPQPTPRTLTGIRYCVRCLAVYRQDFQMCPFDGETLVIGAADPWIGTSVGAHYVIDGFIGEGAMGRVYRAHRSDLPDRTYAIKIMIGDYAATAQMRARFQLEAENASKLAHPNVVGVVDYGATGNGVNFIVMDLVEGPSLGSILMKGPMEPDRVIRLARQLCDGLEHAHSRGMIHRDFKPDNILVVGTGDLEVARIADFGLALSIGAEVRLTTTGIVCTPAYAAPEQLRGEPIDHRVDLYALGTTMYEMLSGGSLPFPGDLDASVRSKLANNAPSVLLVAPKVPPSLVSIIGRLLSNDPARRPRSAKAVGRALAGALAAPRSLMRTEQTIPLRKHAIASKVVAVDASDSSELPNKAASRSPSEAVQRTRAKRTARLRRRSLGRRLVNMFALGITLGGALAWFGRVPWSAPIAESAPAPIVHEVAPALPPPPPLPAASVRPVSAPNAAETHVVEPVPAAPVIDYTIAKPVAKAVAKKPISRAAPSPSALLQRRYGAIAFQLRQLDVWLGRENTDDLWDALRGVEITDRMNESERDEAGAQLLQIQQAAAERSPVR